MNTTKNDGALNSRVYSTARTFQVFNALSLPEQVLFLTEAAKRRVAEGLTPEDAAILVNNEFASLLRDDGIDPDTVTRASLDAHRELSRSKDQ